MSTDANETKAKEKVIQVYVAGSSKSIERARAFVDLVKAHPRMAITHDWIAAVDASSAAGVTDDLLHDSVRLRLACDDMIGVDLADVLVVLAEEAPTGRGMWFELGYGCALRGRLTIIVSGGAKRSIFTVPGIVDHECLGDDSDAQAWRVLLAIERAANPHHGGASR